MPDEGFRKWLGVEYEVMQERHAVVGMPVRDEMRNLRGVVQGGAVAALIDVGMATAASGGNYDTRLRPMVTLEMKINYLAPATGERLTCVSDVVSAGSRTAVVRCEVHTDAGKVCAAALGTFMTRRVHKSDPENMAPPAG
ncbi:MAG: hypothetical protein ACI8W7_002762 [Gammaproteobacteria bacterium]|jgi:uncharacterized protein (TIGR00369 family)